MAKILVITFSDVERDPRVRRQIRLLLAHADVVLASPGTNPFGQVGHMKLEAGGASLLGQRIRTVFRLAARAFEQHYWSQHVVKDALLKLGGTRFDLVISNDVECLPLALRVAGDAPVVLDAHEYAPAEFEDQLLWRLVQKPYKQYLCSRYLRESAALITVSQGIADEYLKNYSRSAIVVPNACDFMDLTPSPMERERIRLVHHGLALRSRHLEGMIDMFEHLDERFSLTFMLVPAQSGYLDELKRRAAAHSSISFVEPVPVTEICGATNCFDVGVFLLPTTNFNYMHALPNKFFEFVQSRLAVAIGPSPEMASYVRRHDLGVIAQDFSPEAFANALNGMTSEDCARFKENAHAAAAELAFERFGADFMRVVAATVHPLQLSNAD